MNRIPIRSINTKNTSNDSLYAKREHIYVKFYTGVLKNIKTLSSAGMLLIFFGLPWLNWNNRQAVLFDLPNRQFHIFDTTFWPQDFMLLSWILIISAFGLFFITSLAGRIWCGYTCPQFVWTWFFIWAERVCEGDRNKRIRLSAVPWNLNKIVRKSCKHLIWIIIAIITSVGFIGYFSPIQNLISRILIWQLGVWELWWLGFFIVATYLNAGWLREQVCIYMCPYARFQSVMFDSDTLIISYDAARGENRGERSRKKENYKEEGLGDCIDCNICVHVCPVGIDIRDGLQPECIACGACIDACNNVMGRMNYETGLIRYTTENALEGKKSRILRPNVIGYFVVLLLMISSFSYILIQRTPLELDVLRDRTHLYQRLSSGKIENIYALKIANKGQQEQQYKLSVAGLNTVDFIGQKNILVAAGERLELLVRLQVDAEDLTKPNTHITFKAEAINQPDIVEVQESRFLSPP